MDVLEQARQGVAGVRWPYSVRTQTHLHVALLTGGVLCCVGEPRGSGLVRTVVATCFLKPSFQGAGPRGW